MPEKSDDARLMPVEIMYSSQSFQVGFQSGASRALSSFSNSRLENATALPG